MAERTTIGRTDMPLPVRLLNRAGSWRPRHRINAVDLIERAKARCHLDHFGDGDFFEPLSRLLESCQAEAQLNVTGHMALGADVVRTLCTRLLTERDRNCDETIGHQQIRQPLFVLGLPRSGTTILHILLAADPAHRAPLSWEVMEPSISALQNERRQIRRAARNFRFLRWLAPSFSRVHPMGAELPQECVTLMSPSFLTDQYDTMFNVPAYRAWFLRQDMRPAYQMHRRILQHLQSVRGERRWVLKAPAHMFALPALLSTYPDALFVQTHRAPLQSVASVASLITLLRRIFSDQVDPRQIGRDALHYWSDTMRNFLRERERLPADRIVDLSYEQIRRDPVGAVGKIYRHFGWSLSHESEQRMRVILERQSGEGNGWHRYDPSHFAIDPDECAERFTDYGERFGFATEPHAHVLEGDAVA